MTTWNNLLTGWNPATDTTNLWSVSSFFNTIIPSPNYAAGGYSNSFLLYPLQVFASHFPNIVATWLLVFLVYIVPMCILLSLFWMIIRPALLFASAWFK